MLVCTVFLRSARAHPRFSAGTSALKVRERQSYISLKYRLCINRVTSRGRVPKTHYLAFMPSNSILPRRTGKRDLGGLLNDGINSLARFLNVLVPFRLPPTYFKLEGCILRRSAIGFVRSSSTTCLVSEHFQFFQSSC